MQVINTNDESSGENSSNTILLPYDPQLAEEKVKKMQAHSNIKAANNVNVRNENVTSDKITLLNATDHKQYKENSAITNTSTTTINTIAADEYNNIVPYDASVARAKLIELEINKVNTAKNDGIKKKDNNKNKEQADENVNDAIVVCDDVCVEGKMICTDNTLTSQDTETKLTDNNITNDIKRNVLIQQKQCDVVQEAPVKNVENTMKNTWEEFTEHNGEGEDERKIDRETTPVLTKKESSGVVNIVTEEKADLENVQIDMSASTSESSQHESQLQEEQECLETEKWNVNNKSTKVGFTIEPNAQYKHDVCTTEKEWISESAKSDHTDDENDDNNNNETATKLESEDSCAVELFTFDKIKMINKDAHSADYVRKLTTSINTVRELRRRFYLIANENVCILIHKYGVESELNNHKLKSSDLIPSCLEADKPFTLPVNGERVVKLPEMIEKPLIQMYYFALSTLTQYEWRTITKLLTSSTNSANINSHLTSLRNLHVRRLQSINSVLETSSLTAARRTMLQTLNNELRVKTNAYKEIINTDRKTVEPLPREYLSYTANSKRRHLCGSINQSDDITITRSHKSHKMSSSMPNVTAAIHNKHKGCEDHVQQKSKSQQQLQLQQEQQVQKEEEKQEKKTLHNINNNEQKIRTSINTKNAPPTLQTQTRYSKPSQETLEFTMSNHTNSYTQTLLGRFHVNFAAEVRALFVEDCGVVCYRAWREHVKLRKRKSSSLSPSSSPLEKQKTDKIAIQVDMLHDKPDTEQKQSDSEKSNDDKNIKTAAKERESIIFNEHVLTKDKLVEYNELLLCCHRALTKYLVNIFGWNDAYAEPIAKSLVITILR